MENNSLEQISFDDMGLTTLGLHEPMKKSLTFIKRHNVKSIDHYGSIIRKRVVCPKRIMTVLDTYLVVYR